MSPKGCDTASHAPGTTRAHKSLAGHQSEKNSSLRHAGWAIRVIALWYWWSRGLA